MATLEQHFLRIYMLFGGKQETSLQLEEVAKAVNSSERNARILLNKMSTSGWVIWEPARGRGKRSVLKFLVTPQQVEQDNFADMIEHNHFVKSGKKAAGQQQKIRDLVRENFGTFITNDGVNIKIPYYRPVDELKPVVPQRRTERHLIRQCFSGLTRFDPFQKQAVPDLAHYWLNNEIKDEWQFFLRKGLHFSDGSLLTAEHIRRCIDNARQSPAFRDLFRDIEQITVQGELRITFTLIRPDRHFAELMSTIPAKIFRTHEGKILCSGPFYIAEHTSSLLCMRKNRYFHYASPMIDEVNIYPFDTQDMNMGFISLLRTYQSEAINKPRERKLDQGASYLLVDRAGHCADFHWRSFLNDVLQSVEILRLSELKRDYASSLSFSAGMLPDWNHRTIDYGVSNPAFGNNQPLTLATFSQPELVHLARGISRLLQSHGISCEIQEVSFLEFMSGKLSGIDIWLTNFMVDFEDVASFKNWLTGDNCLRRLPKEQIEMLTAILNNAGGQDYTTFREVVAKHFMHLTRERWLLPLFHHWLDYESDSAFTWRDLNTIGWPDFSQVWIE